jgi:branched-chain amino acid transport system ATP-binding protein
MLLEQQRRSIVLKISGLRAGYGAIEILHGIDLRVDAGEIIAVLGSNGAGKSTLNNNICGIYRPFSGNIQFDGEDLVGATSARIVAAGLIQVPEGRRIFPNLTTLENLALGSYRRGRANRARNLARVLATFPRLEERLGQRAGTLSGGEQQMLAIGRGLMAEPKLLIFDEPSLGLSPRLFEEMFSLIRDINGEGLAIVLVEQNVIQSLSVAHRAYVMENGVFSMSGPACTLMQDPGLRRSYLGI